MPLERGRLDNETSKCSFANDCGCHGRRRLDSERSNCSIGSGSRKSRNASDTCNSTNERCRLNSERSNYSADSGYDSRGRSRNDNENSNISLNNEQVGQNVESTEQDRNGNDVSISRGFPLFKHDANKNSVFQSCSLPRNETKRNVKKHGASDPLSNDQNGNGNNESTIHDLSCIGKDWNAYDRSRVRDHSNDISDGKGDIYVLMEEVDPPENSKEKDDDDTNNIENKESSMTHLYARQWHSNYPTSSRPSSSQDSRPWSHRKSKSCSDEFTNRTEIVAHRANTRKRYKSEGASESDPLLQLPQQRDDIDDCPFKNGADCAETRVFIEECDASVSNFEVKNNERSEVNRESDSHLQLEEQPNAVKAFQNDKAEFNESTQIRDCIGCNELELEGQDSPNVQSHLALENARKRVEKDHTVVPNLITELEEKLRDSLTVNCDKENCRTSSVATICDMYETPFADGQKSKQACCSACSGIYAEFLNRIDALTNDYQWQNKRIEEAVSSTRKLKVFVTRVFKIGVIIIISVLCTSLALVLVRSLFGCNDWFHEVFNRNITMRVAGLQNQYVDVSDMVNDLMTRTRSVIQLTNGNTLSRNGNRYSMTWKARDHQGQGSLRLSERKDAVIATTGAYYAIYTKLHYNATLSNMTNVRLEYDVIQKASDGLVPVQHAVKEFTAFNGPLRYELKSQTMLYVFPDDEIQISVRPDQLRYIATFSMAHEFSMFEVS